MDTKTFRIDESKRQDLIKLVRRLSYREGAFTLVSGEKSSFYIDLKSTTLDPSGAKLIGEICASLILSAFPETQGVGGLTLGADPISTAVSIMGLGQGAHWPAFIVRKKPKGHGTQEYIEGISNLPTGAKVIVLEDVVTKGGSSVDAVKKICAEGFQPLAVLAIVDRKAGGSERIRSEVGLQLISLMTIDEVVGKSD